MSTFDTNIVNASLWRRTVEINGTVKFASFVRFDDGTELGPFPDRAAAENAFEKWCEAGFHRPGSNVVAFPFSRKGGAR